MSLKRLEPEDFLISTEAIVAPAFAGGSKTPTGDAADQGGTSAAYYTAYLGSDGKTEYAVASFDSGGSDEEKAIYGALKCILGGDPSSSSGEVLAIERSRFKQSIYPFTFACGGGAVANDATFTTTDAGREFVCGNAKLYPDVGLAIGGSGIDTGLSCDSEEVITSNYIFIRARNAEFNYSTNPTFIDSEGGVRFTDFITAPQTFITTVGLYNDNGDLLAVAKLSKPLKKDFTKEALIRVKLDF